MGNFAPMNGSSIHIFASPQSWVEEAARQQLRHVANWPDVQAIAGMPDLHPGRYGPIGCTTATGKTVYPDLIGTDIGCGMALWKLDLSFHRLKLDKACHQLSKLEDYKIESLPDSLKQIEFDNPLLVQPFIASLGTIGGGNHFCEIQVIHDIIDTEKAQNLGLKKGSLVLLIHTGSRGLGAFIHARYRKDGNQGLLLEEDGKAYLKDHDTALHFAALNRQQIAERAIRLLKTEGCELLDIPHNFAEFHSTKILHRKGAAPSDRGLVPIPGSRGDFTYVVSPETPLSDSLYSVAHGAGRRYERSSMPGRVRKNANSLEELTRNPFGGRVICTDKQLLMEEAPLAYKDIQQVISDLETFRLAKTAFILRPVITFKSAHKQERKSR